MIEVHGEDLLVNCSPTSKGERRSEHAAFPKRRFTQTDAK